MVVLAAAIVNLRLLMYSASIRPYFGRESLARRIAVSYLLVDNAFALIVGRFGGRMHAPGKFEYLLGLSLPIWLWALRGFDIERFKPELVCIEAGNEEVRGFISKYFPEHGYERIEEYLKYDKTNWYYRPVPGR